MRRSSPSAREVETQHERHIDSLETTSQLYSIVKALLRDKKPVRCYLLASSVIDKPDTSEHAMADQDLLE
jgi:hypothetical protein